MKFTQRIIPYRFGLAGYIKHCVLQIRVKHYLY